MNSLQLNLFTPQFPTWTEINIKWLFDYLSSLYPEMKLILENVQDGFDNISYQEIKQTAFKKVELKFYTGYYDEFVTWAKNRNYIACDLMQNFGDWSGMCETYDNWEEFLEMVPLRIKNCKERFEEYKNKIRKREKKNGR